MENNITAPTDYVQVYQGAALIREYRDTGLGIFSLQQYKVNIKTPNLTATLGPYQSG